MSNEIPPQIFNQAHGPYGELVEIESGHDLTASLSQIEAAPTLAEKGRLLREMTPVERHQTLGALPAPLVAALIEGDPEQNTALIANLPAEKYRQVINLGTAAQGRAWLERAVGSGSLAGSILPSLMTASDLADMLLTDPGVRRALPRLLNFERAERWRQLLTTNEWHKNIDELLMADTDELLARISIKNKAVKAVLQSLLDYVPELYLEVVNLARERVTRIDENPDEFEDLTATPFGMPELLGSAVTDEGAATDKAVEASPLAELIPEGGDPVFALATASLNPARKAVLEDQLKTLLRNEIVATASFAQADMQRAAGRVLFYLRAGLESFGPTLGDATRALETHHLNEINAIGARLAEGFRQRALALSGLRDWLDARQKHFLDAMKLPEAGVHPETREPVLYLAGRAKQDRAEWQPMPISEVQSRLSEIAAWGGLVRAAFGTVDRMHTSTAQPKPAPGTKPPAERFSPWSYIAAGSRSWSAPSKTMPPSAVSTAPASATAWMKPDRLCWTLWTPPPTPPGNPPTPKPAPANCSCAPSAKSKPCPCQVRAWDDGDRKWPPCPKFGEPEGKPPSPQFWGKWKRSLSFVNGSYNCFSFGAG